MCENLHDRGIPTHRIVIDGTVFNLFPRLREVYELMREDVIHHWGRYPTSALSSNDCFRICSSLTWGRKTAYRTIRRSHAFRYLPYDKGIGNVPVESGITACSNDRIALDAMEVQDSKEKVLAYLA